MTNSFFISPIIGKLDFNVITICSASASNSNCTIHSTAAISYKTQRPAIATRSFGNLYFFNVVFMKRY